MKEQKKTEDILFEFIKNVIYKPEDAYLNVDELPSEFQELGEGLSFLGQCVREQKAFGKTLISGDFEHNIPSVENGIAAPLKEVHGILKHLMWQSREVAKGDYNQRLDHFGELSESFNSMVSQLKEREESLKKKNHELENFLEMFKDITSDAPYYIIIVHRENGRITYLNKSAQHMKQMFPTLYEKIYKKVISCYMDAMITITGEQDSKEQYYQVITESHPEDEYCVYMVVDITNELEQKLELENMAYQDEMTGVNNRRYSQILMRELQREHHRFAVAFVDLDHLKYCNDVFGHDYGDQYIKEVCYFLQEECKGATICRVGGDEFIVIKEFSSASAMETYFKEIAQKFLDSYKEPFQKSFSYGISECLSENQESVSIALEEADRRMYQYKLEHKQKIHYTDQRL